MKLLNTILSVVVFGMMVLTTIPMTASAAGDETCVRCGVPTVLRSVNCTLVRLHFTQSQVGPVAIWLYDADGATIYDRSELDRIFIKEKSDTYAICAGTVGRAHKVTISRCTPEIADPISFEGDVLGAFRASAKDPIALPD